MRVVVVGGLNQDVVVRAEHRARGGETVVGEGPRWSPGGKGANTAYAAALAGAEVAMCGAVGADPAGEEQVADLVRAGVDVSAVLRREGSGTGAALIVVTPDGENAITVGAGANGTLTDEEVRAGCAGAGLVLAQSEVGAAATDAAAAYAAEVGARCVLSLAPVVAVAPATLAAADPLLVNAGEAADLLAGPAPAAAEDLVATLVRRTGCRSAVVTLGAEGAVVGDARGVVRVPSPVVTAVDTTGAGDALAGALVAALAAGVALPDAVAHACAAAARAVTYAGARAPLDR